MNLDLTEDQELLRETFEQLLSVESAFDRVRASEATGFDPKLWNTLVEVGAPGLRVSEALGGTGGSLLDAALLAEQVGRHLASGPIIEAICACSGLATLDVDEARALVRAVLSGDRIVSFVPRVVDDRRTLVPGGAAATAVVAFDGEALVRVERETAPMRESDLGTGGFAYWDFAESGNDSSRSVLAEGSEARACFERMREEWRLLSACALIGLGRHAIEIAAAYATERIQFDRPIGSFQAIAHPLAELITLLEGGGVLVWRAIEAIAQGAGDAAALSALSFAWAAEQAPKATRQALHTHGGYGLSDEYDIQLFHRRAKSWALAAGDPRTAYLDAADRRWRGRTAELPDAGAVQLDFGLGKAAVNFGEEARRFFEANPTPPELLVHQHDFDGHDPAFQKKMAEAGLLYASWPTKYGGRGLDVYEVAAFNDVIRAAGRSTHALGTTSMVGQTLNEYASEELKQEVLPRIIRGEAICSLGYTEPGSGSDVAAAVTRAERDGDDWRINGQKMFTSGANIGQYVFLLTRSNPDAKKHRGLTMFLVPLDTPGIEIQPIHTLSDERTNATYYTDVRIPDRYRVGPVDGGWTVLRYALQLEHAGGGGTGKHDFLRNLIDRTAAWASANEREGHAIIEDEHVRDVLARADAVAEINISLTLLDLWSVANELPDRGTGAMVATLQKTTMSEVVSRLMDLAAPESVLKRGSEGAVAEGELEFGYRLASANAIYGGTAEILRSIVAQTALGLPRSRS